MDKRSLLAMASILSLGAAQPAVPQFKAPRIRAGKRYPEQSSRQEMRGYRRAQGGPGIRLVEGMYVRN
jgi:hypothetical protein